MKKLKYFLIPLFAVVELKQQLGYDAAGLVLVSFFIVSDGDFLHWLQLTLLFLLGFRLLFILERRTL